MTDRADPFVVLREPVVPLEPRPAFAADLRRQLLEELGITEPTGGTMTTTSAVHATGLIPYIAVRGAADAIDFYRSAFGAVETLRVTADDGRVGHAEITIGDVRIMLSDEYPEIGVASPTTLGGSSFALYLEVDDCDAVFSRAVAAGATTEREPADQTHGNRNAVVRDPFGHRWMISSHIEDVSLAEYRDRETGWTVTGGDDDESV